MPRRTFSRRPSTRRFPARKAKGAASMDPMMFVRKASGVKEEEAFVPSFEYKDLPVHPGLRDNILKKGYTVPTPIQNASILPITEGRDILGIANTGTGKTAAFLIPMIQRILDEPRERVLILVPTREIASQIQDELTAFAMGLRIRSTVCVGGLFIGRQIMSLKQGPQFVIATPGRLKDLQDRRAIDLGSFTRVVLDEADRMVDMGFINEVRAFLAVIPDDVQLLFFSATLPKEVQHLIHSFLKDPVTVSVKLRDTSENVDQDIIRVAGGDKMKILEKLLREEHLTKVLIFARTKRGVDKLTRSLLDSGFKAVCIHGDKAQYQRQKALDAFKANHVEILVATDVAARGLDIPNVSHVINYEIPQTYEDYVHRIGRTGRANQKGHALTFVD